MTLEELAKEVEKLKYQVRTLAETVDYTSHPIEALILAMDWDEGDIERAHDIFERYDDKLQNGEPVDWHAFEAELKEEFAIGYQTVKSIIISFYQNHQWTDVCYHYAMSFEPTTPIEFHHITRGKE